jgi:hypothetical protein
LPEFYILADFSLVYPVIHSKRLAVRRSVLLSLTTITLTATFGYGQSCQKTRRLFSTTALTWITGQLFQHEMQNVILDTHQYLSNVEMRDHDLSFDSYQKAIDQLAAKIDRITKSVPVLVGEWSLFNSYAAGIDTQGGINPTQHCFQGVAHHNNEKLKQIYQALWKKQTAAWSHGIGSIYWTYKLNVDTVNEPAWYGWDCWALQRAIDKAWVSRQDI